MKKALMKYKGDNVATVLENIDKGETLQIISEQNQVVCEIKAINFIPFGNKIALEHVANSEDVIKSGYSIGKSSKDIKKGSLVHVHNVKSERINFPQSIIQEIIRQMGIEVDE